MTDQEKAFQPAPRKICVKCGFIPDDGSVYCIRDGSPLQAFGTDRLIGTTVAERYQILEVLGRGGMSVVYKARHLFMNRFVAFKMIRSDFAGDDQLLQRFQQEATAVSSLKHPNIVPVFDFGMLDDDSPFLIMEFLEGEDLDRVIKASGPLDYRRALRLFIEIARGLEHAHRQGIIHRDLKPSNILITRDHEGADIPVVVDFGIARRSIDVESRGKRLTATGQVLGSPLYMSPEQCQARDVDARSDVYSLGCVLYMALTGEPPVEGRNVVETLKKQLSEPARPFRLVAPGADLPEALEACVFKAMEKEPERRYQSMDELRQALCQFLPDPADAGGVSPHSNTAATVFASVALAAIVAAIFYISSGRERPLPEPSAARAPKPEIIPAPKPEIIPAPVAEKPVPVQTDSRTEAQDPEQSPAPVNAQVEPSRAPVTEPQPATLSSRPLDIGPAPGHRRIRPAACTIDLSRFGGDWNIDRMVTSGTLSTVAPGSGKGYGTVFDIVLRHDCQDLEQAAGNCLADLKKSYAVRATDRLQHAGTQPGQVVLFQEIEYASVKENAYSPTGKKTYVVYYSDGSAIHALQVVRGSASDSRARDLALSLANAVKPN